ncbi:hypothetical protein CYMTET_27179 [Cymbomonas tetramitiformis]|uniref:Uncharacterized protein n=1 Tax=Cymbomonas tetramitiformis TaxID=36881 RepID=A0AAE0KX50_9CHLO|nr:hypothetical protein CYMTET_27179 [Cymbomonas tetramitiformis]
MDAVSGHRKGDQRPQVSDFVEREQLLQELASIREERDALIEHASQSVDIESESQNVENTLLNLLKTVSNEREARRAAEEELEEARQALEEERVGAYNERQQLLDTHAEAAAVHSNNLKQAMAIIADLRKALERSMDRSQEVEHVTQTAYVDGAADVVHRLKGSLLNFTAAQEAFHDPNLLGVVADAVKISVKHLSNCFMESLGEEAAGVLQTALQASLVHPLMRILPELAARMHPPPKAGEATPSIGPMSSEMKKKFVIWLAIERQRRQNAESTLSAASEALARSESSRMEATKRWLDAVQTIELNSDPPPQLRGDEEPEKRSSHTSSITGREQGNLPISVSASASKLSETSLSKDDGLLTAKENSPPAPVVTMFPAIMNVLSTLLRLVVVSLAAGYRKLFSPRSSGPSALEIAVPVILCMLIFFQSWF